MLAGHQVPDLKDFFLDRQGLVETVLSYLQHTTPCFAAGVLLVDEGDAEVVLHRCRPVDDLFLQAMQQRLMRSYWLFAGTALAEPEVRVTVHGVAVSGPYEPPRSLLTTPILTGGPVSGMIAIASIFPDAFCSGDLCTLSVLAARAATSLGNVRLAAWREAP
jgi:GAF domain-containing protein